MREGELGGGREMATGIGLGVIKEGSTGEELWGCGFGEESWDLSREPTDGDDFLSFTLFGVKNWSSIFSMERLTDPSSPLFTLCLSGDTAPTSCVSFTSSSDCLSKLVSLT